MTGESRGEAHASIEHLGEAGILARILPLLAQGDDVEVGPGDDAAVLRLASPRLVVSTDTLTEGRDFLLDATRPDWIGTKAATQNLADIAAMGARPQAVVVALSAPESTAADVLDGISRGLSRRCGEYGVSVVGGDLGAAEALSITVTALGALPEGQDPVRRSGARPGDVLAVGTERLGRSAAGLAWVLAGRADAPIARELVAWHDAPAPDLSLGWLAAPGAATAMIDVSDGLSRDGGRIARAGGVVIDLDRTALAPDVAALRDVAEALNALDPSTSADPWTWVLHGGEEHALLATFPPGAVPAGFRPLGIVRSVPAGTEPALLLEGAEIIGDAWDHFA